MKYGQKGCKKQAFMELNIYQQSIVNLFKEQYYFLLDDVIAVESLQTIGNVPEQFEALNILLHAGDMEGIKKFNAGSDKDTYDDYSYIMLKLKDKTILLCVWDSDELYDNPYIVRWKVL